MPRTADCLAERSGDENRVRVTPTDSVPEGYRVRHFDELGEPAQDAVAGLDAGSAVCDAPELTAGEVIVFTDYYRVE